MIPPWACEPYRGELGLVVRVLVVVRVVDVDVDPVLPVVVVARGVTGPARPQLAAEQPGPDPEDEDP